MKTCFQTYDRMGTLTYLKAIRKLGDFCFFDLECPCFYCCHCLMEMPGSDQHMLCCLSFFCSRPQRGRQQETMAFNCYSDGKHCICSGRCRDCHCGRDEKEARQINLFATSWRCNDKSSHLA